MWETLVSTPRGRISTRNFTMLLTTLLVACFSYILIAAPTAHAAPTAEWQDDTKILYDGLIYAGPGEVKATDQIAHAIPPGTIYYLAPKGNYVHIIYFEGNGNYLDADKAKYIRFDDTNHDGSLLENPTAPVQISITPRAPPSPPTQGITSCAIDGIGWIVCPVMTFLADGMDWIYSKVSGFLEVRPLLTVQDSPMYIAWSYVRNLANILFIVGFIIVIYSQLTGVGLSNHSIKKMLPRVVVTAVLVNTSYWICAVAVDAFNILGYSIVDVFDSIEHQMVGAGGNTWDIDWASMTTLILSGGAVAGGSIAAYLGITAVITAGAGAGILGMVFLLVPLLISVFFIVLVTFLILAARQAIITILIILAPLAFIAYLLPNTESWFEKWRKTLFTLLLVFPAFSVVFAGSQLAAVAIMQNASGDNALTMILLAMGVQVAPLAITPLLLKLGGGVLNRFAGIVNNPTKGVFDRGKNWARDRSGVNAARGERILSARANQGTLRRFTGQRMAYARMQRRQTREGQKSANEALTKGYFSQTAEGRAIHRLNERAKFEQGYGDHHNQASWENSVRTNAFLRTRAHQSHEAHERASLYKSEVDAEGNEHWQHTVQTTPGLRNIRHTTKMAEGRAKLLDDSMNAVDDAALQIAVNNNVAGLRNVKIQTDVANARAALEKAHVEADAKEQWLNTVQATGGLRNTRTQTFLAEGRAKLVDESLTAADDRALQTAIDTTAHLRATKIRADVDNAEAALRKAHVEADAKEQWQHSLQASPGLLNVKQQTHLAEGRAKLLDEAVTASNERALQEHILGSTSLLRTVQDTYTEQGRAAQAKELIEDKSKLAWEETTLNDRTIYSRQLERQSYAKKIKAVKDEWESILVEASAGRTDDYQDRHGPITSDVANAIDDIKEADLTIAAEAKRKSNAEHVFKSTLTKQMKADADLLKRASGIDEYGKDKVLSQLSKEGSALHMENVAAIESYMANEGYTLEEEKTILQGGALRDGSAPGDMHRHAALRRILLSNGNNWAAQETYDYVVSQGFKYDPDANSGAGGFVDENNNLLSESEVSRRRDLQQIFKDADSKSPLKVDYLSGTDKGFLENGMLMRSDPTRTASEQALIRDIGQGKIDGDRAFASDIDIIMRQVQIFKDPENRERLTDEQRKKYVETLNSMLEDPLLGGKMSERNWGMTKVVANLLDETDTRSDDEKIRTYVNRKGQEAQIERPVTWEYTYAVDADEE